MRVAIDVRACLGPGAGINVYTAELIKALARLDVDLAMWFSARNVVAAGQMLLPELRALQPDVRLLTTRLSNQLLYSVPAEFVWRHWPRWLPPPQWLPRDLDLFHTPFWPLPIDRRIPVVLTIHDLLALEHPEWATVKMRSQQATIRALAPRAAHILADSEATRRSILELTRVPPERVTTVYLGVSDEFRRPVPPEELAQVRQLYGLERPYIISLCTRDPRKNLGLLIDAYDRLCGHLGAEWDLVLVGASGWGEDAVTPRLERERPGRLCVTGHLPREHLLPLLAGAAVMAYPSLGEGFGLPPLEAMAAGCPVVTSDLSSLPEVVGEAALRVDPTQVEAVAAALERVLTDEALAAQLREQGRARAAQFTWERTAQATLQVYRQVVGEGRP